MHGETELGEGTILGEDAGLLTMCRLIDGLAGYVEIGDTDDGIEARTVDRGTAAAAAKFAPRVSGGGGGGGGGGDGGLVFCRGEDFIPRSVSSDGE